MSFTKSNDYLDGRKPTITCDCSEVAAVRYPLELVAADLDANDIGAVGILPAGSVPVALYVDSDDLDSNAHAHDCGFGGPAQRSRYRSGSGLGLRPDRLPGRWPSGCCEQGTGAHCRRRWRPQGRHQVHCWRCHQGCR